MLFCPANDSDWLLGWHDHGFNRCFQETISTVLPCFLITIFTCCQCHFYSRYSTSLDPYRPSNPLTYVYQAFIHVCLILLSFAHLLTFLVAYIWFFNNGQNSLYGYIVCVCLSRQVGWFLCWRLLCLERKRLLPIAPVCRHGYLLVFSWSIMMFVEALYVLNFRSSYWWFALHTWRDKFEFCIFVLRFILTLIAYLIGLKAPAVSRCDDFIPYNRQIDSEVTDSDTNHPYVTCQVPDGVNTNPNHTRFVFYRRFIKLIPVVWPRKSFFLQFVVIFCFFLLILTRVINLFIPIFYKEIVDSLSLHSDQFHWKLICIYSLLKFFQGGGFGSMGVINNFRSFIWIRVQQYTEREMQVKLFTHLHNLSIDWHLNRRTGEVMQIMERGTAAVSTLLNYVGFQVLPVIVDITVAIVYFVVAFNAWFGLLVFLTMGLYLAATFVITEWRIKFRREFNQADNYNRTIGVDSLLNYETVKYYNGERYEVERYQKAIIAKQLADWKNQSSLSLLNIAQSLVINGGLLIGSLLCAYFISALSGISHRLTAGDYVLFSAYILQLYGPLNYFGTYYRLIQQNLTDMENMMSLLSEKQSVCDSISATELRMCHGRLEMKDVSFSYKHERSVLQAVSFCVEPGQTLALVGPSGSGKSTIVRLLYRLYDVDEGQVLFDGQNVRDVKQASLRQAIGVVPQDTVLFNNTIKYNIKYGRMTASDEEVIEAAKFADLHENILSFPDQYDTIVGERGLKLSGGEKQRVAIARTILKAPKFILLDEATSSLDTQTERNIQSALRKVCVGRTTLIVSHRLSTVTHADTILVLRDGCVIERGSHTSLLEQAGLYAQMWNQQCETDCQ